MGTRYVEPRPPRSLAAALAVGVGAGLGFWQTYCEDPDGAVAGPVPDVAAPVSGKLIAAHETPLVEIETWLG
jgi:hypothetical protein